MQRTWHFCTTGTILEPYWSDQGGVALTNDECAQFDASVGFGLTASIELTVQMLNMLDETHYEYAGDENQPLYKNDSRSFAGVRFSP
jgi:iron complex outermembrane recepter protein